MKEKILKVGVAGQSHNGPDFWFFRISCTDEEYEDGLHYEAAKNFAASQFDVDPQFVFDENDDCRAALNLFNWTSVADEDIVVTSDWT